MQVRLWQWGILGAGVTVLLLTTILIAYKRKKAGTEKGNVLEEGPPGDREMSFWEHLAELRSRLLWAIFFWAVGSVVAWSYYDEIFRLLVVPIEPALRKYEIPVTLQSIFEPLMLKLQISVAAGLVIAFPGILYEVMAFIWPALYPHEKRFALKLIPASLLLFGAGIFLAYKLIPVMALFMLQIGLPRMDNPGVKIQVLNFARQYLWSVAKIAAACGLVFQMPLVMMFLGKLGIVTAKGLLRYWRHAIVAIFTLSAIITPTIDPINMTLLAGPIVALYFLSVLLVYITQPGGREGVRGS
ncbi:MAG: twin-arginine translocase subunit TatC [Armatimonadetes bacterium]|nr:twin-arginine translocase subunit TatC [Armatimonadota bacterium]MCX7967422.1 twin-arginine translocase subunit TatC [Armatimonadota bacterium]MDW8142068.1 twin-arginine translocase subunit TatC [Armatimonadota bacterium]